MATRKKSLLEQEISEQEQNHEPAETNTVTLDRDISDTPEEPAVDSAHQEPLADTTGSFDESNYPDMGEDFAGKETVDGELAAADESSLNLDELLCGMDQAQEESEAEGNLTDSNADLQQNAAALGSTTDTPPTTSLAEVDSPAGNTDTPRPKRTTRKKKAELETDVKDMKPEAIYVPTSEPTTASEPAPNSQPAPASRHPSRTHRAEAPVLTIEGGGRWRRQRNGRT